MRCELEQPHVSRGRHPDLGATPQRNTAATRRGPGLNQSSSSRNLFIHAAGYPEHTLNQIEACGLQVQDRDPYGSTRSVKESYVLLTDFRRRREP
jgi:hypothetical protein